MIAAFLAFGEPSSTVFVSVLAYRVIAFWLPIPPGIVAYLQLRRTVGRWREEEATGAPARPPGPDRGGGRGAKLARPRGDDRGYTSKSEVTPPRRGRRSRTLDERTATAQATTRSSSSAPARRADGGAVRGALPDPHARAREGHPGRPALEHGRGRGLSRLRAHHGARPRRQDPAARAEVRRHVRDRRGRLDLGRRRRPRGAHGDGQRAPRPGGDRHRGRRGAQARRPRRGRAGRQGRLLLRGVRRRLLRGRRHRGRRRRRLGRRGGHVPDPLRAQGEPDPPPRRVPRAADPGRADARDRQGRRGPEHGRGGDPRHRRARCRT